MKLLFFIVPFIFLTSCGGGGGGSSSGDAETDSGTVVGGDPGDTPVFDEAILDEDVME